jgi:hypothetical protein
MKPWLAAIANFFLPGLGTLIAGGERRFLGFAWIFGFVGLTYVELSLQTAAPQLYWTMFGCVFVVNTAFAIDAFREAKRHASA